MKKEMKKLMEFITNHLIEILLVIGLLLITVATALINVIASLFVLGVILIFMSIFLFIITKRGG